MEETKINLKISFEELERIFGSPGLGLRYVRQTTFEERQHDVEMGMYGGMWKTYDDWEGWQVANDIRRFLSDPEIQKVGDWKIYLMTMYDVKLGKYCKAPNPDYSFYGICVATHPVTATQIYHVNVYNENRTTRDVKSVILGEITLEELK